MQSFDSSAPARLASIGGWEAVRRYYRPEFGLSLATLRTSRAARLALFLSHYRQLAGFPWQPVDERWLPDHLVDEPRAAPQPLPLAA